VQRLRSPAIRSGRFIRNLLYGINQYHQKSDYHNNYIPNQVAAAGFLGLTSSQQKDKKEIKGHQSGQQIDWFVNDIGKEHPDQEQTQQGQGSNFGFIR
jgi:hypothetical protein